MSRKVTLLQTGKYSWRLESDTGATIIHYIPLGSVFQAHDFIKNWVTSYNTFIDYEVVLLPTNDKKKDDTQ